MLQKSPRLRILLTLLLSNIVWACPTCLRDDPTTPQVLKATMLFTFLPLGLIVIVAYIVWKRSHDSNRKP